MCMRMLIAALLLLQTPDYCEQGRKALDGAKYEAAVEAFTKVVAATPTA